MIWKSCSRIWRVLLAHFLDSEHTSSDIHHPTRAPLALSFLIYKRQSDACSLFESMKSEFPNFTKRFLLIASFMGVCCSPRQIVHHSNLRPLKFTKQHNLMCGHKEVKFHCTAVCFVDSFPMLYIFLPFIHPFSKVYPGRWGGETVWAEFSILTSTQPLLPILLEVH